nr:hypothetical protein [Nocardioides convexus]
MFRALLWLLVVAGAGMLAIVTFTGLTLAVGDPFYEKIWKEVEALPRRRGARSRGRLAARHRRRPGPGDDGDRDGSAGLRDRPAAARRRDHRLRARPGPLRPAARR